MIFQSSTLLNGQTIPTNLTNAMAYGDLTYICHAHFYNYGQVLIILHVGRVEPFVRKETEASDREA